MLSKLTDETRPIMSIQSKYSICPDMVISAYQPPS